MICSLKDFAAIRIVILKSFWIQLTLHLPIEKKNFVTGVQKPGELIISKGKSFPTGVQKVKVTLHFQFPWRKAFQRSVQQIHYIPNMVSGVNH